MKKLAQILIIFACLFAGAFQTQAQRSILIYDNVDIGDSLVVDLPSLSISNDDVEHWSSFYVEALFSSLAVTDTTAAVEIYNTLNYDYTDATDLVPTETIDGSAVSKLRASDANGGTGTIMKTATVTNSYLQYVRFVVDPDATDSGNGKLTLRIVPVYKTGYTPPN